MVADVQLKCAGSSTDRDLAAKVALRQDPHQWHLVFLTFLNAIPLGFYGGVCEMVHCLYFKWSLLILSFRRRNSNCKIFPWLCIFQCPDILIWVYSSFSTNPVLQFQISCMMMPPWTLDVATSTAGLPCLQPTFALIASVNNLYLPPNPIRTNLSFIRWDVNRQGPGHVLKSHCNADCKHKDC